MTDRELIRAAIDASGLSARKFAVEVLVRNERTIRRYLSGEAAMSKVVRAKCEALTRPGE